MSEEEKVLGGFEVETTLSFGVEHLFLLFTQTRLILAHVSKLGRGSVGLTSFLGHFSTGFGKGARKDRLLEKMGNMTPDHILSLNRDNFGVEYGRVVSLTAGRDISGRAELTLLSSDMKVVMHASSQAVQGLRETIESTLGSKASFQF
jgi:hypothetical protein